MRKLLIGLAGPKQSGKTTAAQYLVKCGFDRHSFAAPIKNMMQSLLTDLGYGWQLEYMMNSGKENLLPVLNKSPRYLMQTLGTEWGRQMVDQEIWTNVARNKVNQSLNSIVFDDVRFEDEAAMIRSMGGHIIHVDRGCLVIDEHASEAGIVDNDADFFVDNDDTIADFLVEINCVVAGLW